MVALAPVVAPIPTFRPVPAARIDLLTLSDELYLALTASPAGFTVDPIDYSSPTKGFAVGIKGAELRVSGFLPSRAMIAVWLRDHFESLRVATETRDKVRVFVGGWKDGEDFYLDASIVVDDEATAKALAVKHGQIAYYSIETRESLAPTHSLSGSVN